MKTIYAVVGDYYHRESDIREALDAALAPLTDAGTHRLVYGEAERLSAILEEKPDAVVLFKENRLKPQEDPEALWMTEEIGEAISRYVREGGGWLAWHAGMASFAPDSPYIRMLKGGFLSHPQLQQTVRYEGCAPDDPARAVAFAMRDEHYFVSCDEDGTEVFLRSESVDGRSVAGWRHAHGQGRVVCLTPAHNREGLLLPAFQQILLGSVKRCLG